MIGRRLASPDGRPFLLTGILGVYSLDGRPEIPDTVGNYSGVELMPSQRSVPEFPSFQPAGRIARNPEQGLEMRQVAFVHQCDLWVLIQKSIEKRGPRAKHSHHESGIRTRLKSRCRLCDTRKRGCGQLRHGSFSRSGTLGTLTVTGCCPRRSRLDPKHSLLAGWPTKMAY